MTGDGFHQIQSSEDNQAIASRAGNPMLELQESRIQSGLYEIGDALSIIKDRALWRDGYSSFEEYCTARWGKSTRWAEYQIAAKSVIDNIRRAGVETLPDREIQTRALSSVPSDEQPQVWVSVVATYGEHPTAKEVGEYLMRRQVYAGNFAPLIQWMNSGVMTPKEALATNDALLSAYPKVRGHCLQWHIVKPEVIRELSRLYRQKSETYNEVMDSGWLQDGDGATEVGEMSLVQLREYLDRKSSEHKMQSMVEREAAQGLMPVQLTLFSNDTGRTVKALRSMFSAAYLRQVAQELLDD